MKTRVHFRVPIPNTQLKGLGDTGAGFVSPCVPRKKRCVVIVGDVVGVCLPAFYHSDADIQQRCEFGLRHEPFNPPFSEPLVARYCPCDCFFVSLSFPIFDLESNCCLTFSHLGLCDNCPAYLINTSLSPRSHQKSIFENDDGKSDTADTSSVNPATTYPCGAPRGSHPALLGSHATVYLSGVSAVLATMETEGAPALFQ